MHWMMSTQPELFAENLKFVRSLLHLHSHIFLVLLFNVELLYRRKYSQFWPFLRGRFMVRLVLDREVVPVWVESGGWVGGPWFKALQFFGLCSKLNCSIVVNIHSFSLFYVADLWSGLFWIGSLFSYELNQVAGLGGPWFKALQWAG